jgi:hypothetical protein
MLKLLQNFLFVVTPFQQVKLDSAIFAEERLQDNSHWAKVLYCFVDHVCVCIC